MSYTKTSPLFGTQWRCVHNVIIRDCYPTTFSHARAVSLSRRSPNEAEAHGIRLESEQPQLWCKTCGKPHLL